MHIETGIMLKKQNFLIYTINQKIRGGHKQISKEF